MTHSPRAPLARPEVEAYIVPDGTCFLFDPSQDAGFALDQLGALVWDYCDGQTPPASIVAEVEALLPALPDTAACVHEWLASFEAQGLLVVGTLDPAWRASTTPGVVPATPQEAP